MGAETPWVSTAGDDYFRQGHAAGEIAARLREHDRHFDVINGSIERMSHEMGNIAMTMQKISDGLAARDEKVVATALALKEAEEARRAEAQDKWSFFQKIFGALAGVAAMASIILVIYTLTR